MKPLMLKYLLTVMLLLFAAGCQNNNITFSEPEFINAKLNISQVEIGLCTNASSSGRASQPMIPANENPIYNIWLLQFDAEGIIIGKPQYYQCDEEGELSTVLRPVLRKGQSTVCAVANVGSDFKFEVDDRQVDNLTSFRTMLIDAPLAVDDDSKTGHLKDHSMYLYGFFEGAVEENKPINVLLGRLFLRINLEIINTKDVALTNVEVRIDNVPTVTHIPFVDSPLNNKALFTSYREIINKINAHSTTMLYYYMPENISPSIDNATKVAVTAGGKQATIELGNDSPDVAEERNYTLNRNNIYTFKLNLK